MELADVKTLQQVSRESGIPHTTLNQRLSLKNFNLIENIDYKRLGKRQPILLSPTGIKKITKKITKAGTALG